MTLKETVYADGYAPCYERRGRIRYLLRGNTCIYSGMTPATEFMSTINAAEHVVEAIAEAEGIDPRNVTFYDLQTHHAYSYLREGQYEMMRLTVEYNGRQPQGISEWSPVTPSPETLNLFVIYPN